MIVNIYEYEYVKIVYELRINMVCGLFIMDVINCLSIMTKKNSAEKSTCSFLLF